MAKTAEVASQIVRPCAVGRRSSRRSGTRTPEVVPFQVNTTSRDEVDLREIGQLAVARLEHAHVVELELLEDVGDPALAEALPGQHVDAARRRAATTAPSRPRRCRTPARCRCGSRRGSPRIGARPVDHLGEPGLAVGGAVRAAERRRCFRAAATSRAAWRRGRRRNWDWPDGRSASSTAPKATAPRADLARAAKSGGYYEPWLGRVDPPARSWLARQPCTSERPRGPGFGGGVHPAE